MVSVRLHDRRSDCVSSSSAIQSEFQARNEELIVNVCLHGGRADCVSSSSAMQSEFQARNDVLIVSDLTCLYLIRFNVP